jgi:hypothetical protein
VELDDIDNINVEKELVTINDKSNYIDNSVQPAVASFDKVGKKKKSRKKLLKYFFSETSKGICMS